MKRPGGEKHLLLWTECLCSPQIHDLTVTVLGERLFRKWLKLGEVIQVGPWSDIISVLKRSGKDTSSHPAPAPATLPLHGHSEERLCEGEVAVCKPGRELLTETKPWQNFVLGLSSLHNYGKINFCCFSHPACDTFCGSLSWLRQTTMCVNCWDRIISLLLVGLLGFPPGFLKFI